MGCKVNFGWLQTGWPLIGMCDASNFYLCYRFLNYPYLFCEFNCILLNKKVLLYALNTCITIFKIGITWTSSTTL